MGIFKPNNYKESPIKTVIFTVKYCIYKKLRTALGMLWKYCLIINAVLSQMFV